MVRLSDGTSTIPRRRFFCRDETSSTSLNIIAFDTAKAMSRLISLYRSLTDKELSRFRWETLTSEGVTYLNIDDEGRTHHLLSLAGSERLEALDKTVSSIADLGKNCSDLGLRQFNLVYADLKQGWIDVGVFESFGSKNADKVVEKMDKLVSATALLYSLMESLREMEVSEKKLLRWRKNATPFQLQSTDFSYFDKKIAQQRKKVRHYKNTSLWSREYDKSVGLIAKTVCVVFSRICTVFAPYLSGLPCSTNHPLRLPKLHNLNDGIRVYPEISLCDMLELKRPITRPGPISKATNPLRGNHLLKFYSRELNLNLFLRDDSFVPNSTLYEEKTKKPEKERRSTVFQSATPSTVGGSGLTMRYAQVVVLADKLLNRTTLIEEDARKQMYEMLPLGLRKKIRSKLKGWDVRNEKGWPETARGWREAVNGILVWLFPVANDTLRWQSERSFEKQKFDMNPTVLLVQTLHFSDLEKTETAIVEMLVGLSCICKYENKAISACSF